MVKLDCSLRAATARVIWPASLLRSDASRAPQTSSLPGAERKRECRSYCGSVLCAEHQTPAGRKLLVAAKSNSQRAPPTRALHSIRKRVGVAEVGGGVVASSDFISLEQSSTDSEAITVVSVVSRIGRNATSLQERRARIQLLSHR